MDFQGKKRWPRISPCSRLSEPRVGALTIVLIKSNVFIGFFLWQCAIVDIDEDISSLRFRSIRCAPVHPLHFLQPQRQSSVELRSQQRIFMRARRVLSCTTTHHSHIIASPIIILQITYLHTTSRSSPSDICAISSRDIIARPFWCFKAQVRTTHYKKFKNSSKAWHGTLYTLCTDRTLKFTETINRDEIWRVWRPRALMMSNWLMRKPIQVIFLLLLTIFFQLLLASSLFVLYSSYSKLFFYLKTLPAKW